MFQDFFINQAIIVTIIGFAISIISSHTKPPKQKLLLYAFNATTIIVAISVVIFSHPEKNYTIELIYKILAVASLSMITTLYYYNIKKRTQPESKTIHNIMWVALPSVIFIILSRSWPSEVFAPIFIVLILTITGFIIIKTIQELRITNGYLKSKTIILVTLASIVPATGISLAIIVHVNKNPTFLIGEIIAILCSLSVCIVAYKNLQCHINENHTKYNTKTVTTNYNQNTKLQNQIIYNCEAGDTDEHMTFLAERIVEIVETKKMYLKTDLRVIDIAIKLTTNRTYISQAINQKLGYSFSDFINNYRIEFAKAMLTLPQNSKFTIEVIAEESGFSNVTSLNRAFKAKLNMTPHQYRQSTVYMNEQQNKKQHTNNGLKNLSYGIVNKNNYICKNNIKTKLTP